jgi:hypothetical protein
MDGILNYPWEMGVVLAFVLAGCLDLGRRVAASLKLEQAPQRKEQMGTIRDGMFVLVSLLLGFTLTMAAARFTERRSLLVEESTRSRQPTCVPARFRSPTATIRNNCCGSTWTRGWC